LALWHYRKPDIDALCKGVLAGDRLSIARTLRCVDEAPEWGRKLASKLFAHRRGAQVVGITGNPGAGKSTVVDAMLGALREAGKRVAVLAVDPSSPFSGGAILGDRIRMRRHFADDGVYIRSLATRGSLGGLSGATFDSVRVCDAAGFDVIIIETVGVGQDEVDVARLAHTTVVVLVPGMGDDIQAIKAGLLEIADILLINKSDKEGVAQLERGLQQMLGLVPHNQDWQCPILQAVASRQEGIVGLLRAVGAHQRFLASPQGMGRVRLRAQDIFDRLLDAALVQQGRGKLAGAVAAAHNRVADVNHDPYVEVLALLEKL
jgi:LAO/AO transport system kinase